MINLIAAVSINGVIGSENKIPWHYPQDLKYFKEVTQNTTIIMGRNTFNSIGKPLPNRRNIVITSQKINGIETYNSVQEALNNIKDLNIWFIGGAKIYAEALKYVESIVLTLVPDFIEEKNIIKFPFINPLLFGNPKIFKFKDDNRLYHCIYDKLPLSR